MLQSNEKVAFVITHRKTGKMYVTTSPTIMRKFDTSYQITAAEVLDYDDLDKGEIFSKMKSKEKEA